MRFASRWDLEPQARGAARKRSPIARESEIDHKWPSMSFTPTSAMPDFQNGYHAGLRVGILGGGQLARMLALSAHPLGLVPVALAEGRNTPVGQVVSELVEGDERDADALSRFLASVQVVAFENEFVDCARVISAADRIGSVQLPGVRAMQALQDKSKQKECFLELGISSADYVLYQSEQTIEAWLREVSERYPQGAVLKWGMHGYDGKGLMFFGAGVSFPEATAFVTRGVEKGIRVYAEERVSFAHELALVACRSRSGAFAHYPLVFSKQHQGICLEVTGPATRFGIPEEVEGRAVAYAEAISRNKNIVGCFALECFYLPNGALLVNELAPRVHNSGHFTLDAASTSQFENHWRALLGIALGSTNTSPGFVMRNVLGPEGFQSEGKSVCLPRPNEPLHLHWYGKSEVRAGRKLGHLNARAESEEELNRLKKECEEVVESWRKEVLR